MRVEAVRYCGRSALWLFLLQPWRRKIVETSLSRLPNHSWPQCRLKIVAVDALSGERVVFTRESGVEIVDAVAASCAIPCVWPPVTLNGRRYIDGGSYSLSNADLCTGFAKVLLLEPDVPPFPVIRNSSQEVEQLRLNGAQIEVISPNDVMKAALAAAAAAGNLLDPSLAGVAARIGREQASSEAARIAGLWGHV